MNTPKIGVDYFPLDVHIDDKLKLIEAEFGLTGFAIVVKLWQRIYSLGYYCEWNNEVALLFAKSNNVSGNVVSEILEASIRRGIFDKGLYEKYGVLSSRGIQKRYLLITKRRSKVELFDEYLLISVPQDAKNVYIYSIDVYNNPKNVNRNAQSKVKESKVKESKVKESKVSTEAADAALPARCQYGEYKNVLLSDEDLSKLKTEYPDKYLRYIERVSAYCASTGKTYKNYCAAIQNWILRDDEKPPEYQEWQKPQKLQEPQKPQKSAFNNYEDSNYDHNKTDFTALEEELLNKMLSGE